MLQGKANYFSNFGYKSEDQFLNKKMVLWMIFALKQSWEIY